ncbi:DUF309 domain-containing protein [Halalkalicoccus jeotgali]|uniref:DUF309 domain-containing protein n=1 Tax=Halalkalicoccus jeotgali (strain DSM 18796 / CECT 7217 / JCM 14584 / KCTC 4019 / B3) TaxID=795797 RepID=D8J948_HALJB|nr:DUF309 domain-containing protein [Halalkalicoccus jeotgali]ADJ16317.1 hypothetical protein HacjB3_14690 [Halalkalicoccus jeotgali B3]ELY37052.1 hypothetical protein C497_09923 [Halalkalicoccus jeotgali B3]
MTGRDTPPIGESRDGLERSLRAGIAVYNAGHYHAAHDAWEAIWLDLPDGEDERLLHGLIQYTAAIHHARARNWAGATGLGGSAREYLDGLSETHRGVDLGPVRRALANLGADPEWIERARPPRLTHRGEALSGADLDAEECLLAAMPLASGRGEDVAAVERACEYAREAIETGTSNPFLALCTDYVRRPTHRDLVYGRLTDHAARRRSRERDVAGLFDPDG